MFGGRDAHTKPRQGLSPKTQGKGPGKVTRTSIRRTLAPKSHFSK